MNSSSNPFSGTFMSSGLTASDHDLAANCLQACTMCSQFLDELLPCESGRCCQGNHGQGRHGEADRSLLCFFSRFEAAVHGDAVAMAWSRTIGL